MPQPLDRLAQTVLRNRWRTLPRWLRRASLPLSTLAAFGLTRLGAALLGHDAATRTLDLAFTLSITLAFLVGFPSFDLLARNRTAARLDRWPIPPAERFTFLAGGMARALLPLVGLTTMLALPALLSGDRRAFLILALEPAATLVVTLAFALRLHLGALAALCAPASDRFRQLAGGLGPPETALLYYSPALTFGGGLAAAIGFDVGLRVWLDKGDSSLLLGATVIVGWLAVSAVTAARRTFLRTFHVAIARFHEAETTPPWREGELPPTPRVAALGAVLSPHARPLFTALLREYRRRFRVVPPLVTLACLGLVLQAQSVAATPLGLALVASALVLIVFSPAFKLVGRELRPSGPNPRALPLTAGAWVQSLGLLGALESAPVVGAAAVGGARLAGASGALVAGGVTLAFAAVTQALSVRLALRVAPETGLVASVFRAAGLVVLGAVAWTAQELT